jgi:PD-(D/E)XK endonuclease
MVLTTDQKGAIAELAIAQAAIEIGIEVYAPVTSGGRYDLLFLVDGRLVRVQCKSAVRRGDVVVIPCRSRRRGPDGFVHRPYTAEEVDVIAGYCAAVGRCYVVSVDRFFRRAMIQLRLEPPKNNQQLRILWARDFELERLHWLPEGP